MKYKNAFTVFPKKLRKMENIKVISGTNV